MRKVRFLEAPAPRVEGLRSVGLVEIPVPPEICWFPFLGYEVDFRFLIGGSRGDGQCAVRVWS